MTPSPDRNVFYYKQVLIGDKIKQSLINSRVDLVSVFLSVFHCHFDPQSSIKVFVLCFDLKTENSKQRNINSCFDSVFVKTGMFQCRVLTQLRYNYV
nr:MAG TPA: hypothetical protein [Caudoviricetes sp.]